jgi:hypothetical protein
LRPSGVNRTLRGEVFGGVGSGVAVAAFFAAHRFFCPSDRRLRADAFVLRVVERFAAGAEG